jgi:feruloyl-CoA synthase
MSDTPRALPEFAPAEVEVEHLRGGQMILRSTMPLGPYPDHLLTYLTNWADSEPDRVFLAEREGGDTNNPWRELTYGQALAQTKAIAQSLLDRKLNTDTPVMILSENSIDAGLLILAAMYVGVIVVPVSPAYSLMSEDYGKLKHVVDLIDPAIIYVSNGKKFERALQALDLANIEVVVSSDAPDGITTTAFEKLLDTTATNAVEDALSQVGPDTVAKILFTSGSTGYPKGVLNTHKMLCSNQQAMAQTWPFIENKPPVLLDWLPWNHTFGGNHNFNMILRNGGTLYIDSGKPMLGLVEHSIANLREVSPTAYFNVPAGFDMIIPYLEKDDELRDKFFANLDMAFYAAAALPQNLWERLEKLSIASRGHKVSFTSAWGSTETAPLVTCVHFPIDRAGVIGLPVPGCELKLIPNGGKLEVRVKGPCITPGYFKAPKLFAEAIDEDGFYIIGDAVKFDDPDDPNKGIVFDGRVAEDFKLQTGSWVSVGELRVNAIAAASPIIRDAVVTGHNLTEIGLLIFPNIEEAASVAGMTPNTPLDRILGNEKLHEFLRQKFQAYNADNPGSSKRIKRLLLLAEPANIDAGEITDKGYLSQRTILELRSNEVTRLYEGGIGVILI